MKKVLCVILCLLLIACPVFADETEESENKNTRGSSVSNSVTGVPTNLVVTEELKCIPCAITNLAAYWCNRGYSEFGCSTASQQYDVVWYVQSNMINAGSAAANANINAGFSWFTHYTGTEVYGLEANNYWRGSFDYYDIIEEIDSGRPLLLGFAGTSGSPYGSHMTVCAGYLIEGSTSYVYLSDGWHTGYQLVEYKPETYNDFIAKVRIVVIAE